MKSFTKRNRITKVGLVALIGLSLAAKSFADTGFSGEIVGTREYAYYGYVKVAAVLRQGQLKSVRILEYPNHAGYSRYVASVALPLLIREAVQVQDSHVNLISGATYTSEAFVRSLDAALRKAGA